MPAFDTYRDHPRHPRQGGWVKVLAAHYLAQVGIAMLVIIVIGLLLFAFAQPAFVWL
jgi:hypothetical protein